MKQKLDKTGQDAIEVVEEEIRRSKETKRDMTAKLEVMHQCHQISFLVWLKFAIIIHVLHFLRNNQKTSVQNKTWLYHYRPTVELDIKISDITK